MAVFSIVEWRVKHPLNSPLDHFLWVIFRIMILAEEENPWEQKFCLAVYSAGFPWGRKCMWTGKMGRVGWFESWFWVCSTQIYSMVEFWPLQPQDKPGEVMASQVNYSEFYMQKNSKYWLQIASHWITCARACGQWWEGKHCCGRRANTFPAELWIDCRVTVHKIPNYGFINLGVACSVKILACDYSDK